MTQIKTCFFALTYVATLAIPAGAQESSDGRTAAAPAPSHASGALEREFLLGDPGGAGLPDAWVGTVRAEVAF